jgi:hypothetical protein
MTTKKKYKQPKTKANLHQVVLYADQLSNLLDKIADYEYQSYDSFTCTLTQDKTGKVVVTMRGEYDEPVILDEDIEI